MEEILPYLIGGLILFLFAISQLSHNLRSLFNNQAKTIIGRYTNNIFLSVLIGTIITILLDSSSAVIILVIVFINAESLTFRQAIGIIMGANIGTTISSQIIALDVGRYAVIPLLIGLVLQMFSKKERTSRYGKTIFYFGLLFFGLFLMEESVMPLKDSLLFETWIQRIDNHYLEGALVGGFITVILQSSSATVGIAIVLGKQKLISIASGIAIMLGAELGTCANTLLATIRGSRTAIKAGVFHFLFNLTTILIGLAIFHPFVEFIKKISFDQGIDNHIANAHVLFNIAGVLAFLPFVGLIERGLNYFLPDKKNLNPA